jgi:hypothetical protein
MRRRGQRRRERASGALAAVVAAQVVAACAAVLLVRPGGLLPALPASATALVRSVRADPSLAEPGPDRAPGVTIELGPPADPTADDSRPKTYRGRPVHYDRWDVWGPRIRGCESGGGPLHPGSYTARNPQSSASGAYQVTDGSWAGEFGVGRAHLASPAQQEAQAFALFVRRGTQPWAASQGCWEL